MRVAKAVTRSMICSFYLLLYPDWKWYIVAMLVLPGAVSCGDRC